MTARPTFTLATIMVAIAAFSLMSSAARASTEAETILHETIEFADLLASAGGGMTEIASFGPLGDAGNTVISHQVVGGYTANVIATNGTLRADTLGGNYLFDARIGVTPPGGDVIFALTSVAGEATTIGETDTFEGIASTIFGEPNPGGGQPILPGLLEIEFFENFDEATAAVDNTFTDFSIEFYEYTAIDGNFELGELSAAAPYSDDTHSHATAGIDFFTFTLPQNGDLAILTEASTNGVNGADVRDTEIGLFDANDRLMIQNDDVDFENDNFYSEINMINLAAGDYTLVTSSYNSSLNDTMSVGDDISGVTSGSDFGDYKLTVSFTPSVGTTLSCDFDADGDCDAADLDALYGAFGGADAAFDLSGDGAVNAQDIEPWLVAASSSMNPFNTNSDTFMRGDVNLDGRVNSVDLGLLLNNFGNEDGLSYGAGNMNDDAFVNSTDLGLLLNNFGFGAAAAVSAVPEPTANGWMLLCFAFGVFRLRRVSLEGKNQ